MFSLVSIVLMFSLGSLAYMESLPDGRYLGEGNWSDTDNFFSYYQTYIKFQTNEMHTDYVWSDAQSSVNISFLFNGQGWFDVVFGGNVVGAGFCMQYQCSYDMDINGIHYGETLSFYTNSLHKLGHKKVGTRLSRWEEILVKLNDNNPPSTDPFPPLNPINLDVASQGAFGPLPVN